MQSVLQHPAARCGELLGRGSSRGPCIFLSSLPQCYNLRPTKAGLPSGGYSLARSRYAKSVLRAASLVEAPSRQDASREEPPRSETDRVQKLVAEVAFLTQLTKALQSLPSLESQVSG